MSYFDHVQCHTCGARMDPEKLVAGPGEMPGCPYCGAALNLTDLFGVKDSFVGIDEGEGNNHSLDDLVGGDLYDGRYVDGRAPAPQPHSAGAAQRSAPAPRAADVLRSGRGGAPRAIGGPTAQPRGNAMVPAPRSDSGGAPSAADLLREMKKKR